MFVFNLLRCCSQGQIVVLGISEKLVLWMSKEAVWEEPRWRFLYGGSGCEVRLA